MMEVPTPRYGLGGRSPWSTTRGEVGALTHERDSMREVLLETPADRTTNNRSRPGTLLLVYLLAFQRRPF